MPGSTGKRKQLVKWPGREKSLIKRPGREIKVSKVGIPSFLLRTCYQRLFSVYHTSTHQARNQVLKYTDLWRTFQIQSSHAFSRSCSQHTLCTFFFWLLLFLFCTDKEGTARNRILSQSSPLLTGPLHSSFLTFDRAWGIEMMIQSLSGRHFYYRVSGFRVEAGKHTHTAITISQSRAVGGQRQSWHTTFSGVRQVWAQRMPCTISQTSKCELKK